MSPTSSALRPTQLMRKIEREAITVLETCNNDEYLMAPQGRLPISKDAATQKYLQTQAGRLDVSSYLVTTLTQLNKSPQSIGIIL